MKNKLLVTSIAVLTLSTTLVSASTDFRVQRDSSNNTIIVNGVSDDSKDINIQVIKKMTLKDFAQKSKPGSFSIYVNNTETDENGKFKFTAEIADSDAYSVYIGGSDIKTPIGKDFDFFDKDDYKNAVDYVNQATDEATFLTKAKEKLSELGMDLDINANIDLDSALRLMYAELGENKQLDSSKSVENERLFVSCAAALALNSGKTDNVLGHLEDIIGADETLAGFYNKHANTTERKTLFLKNMTSKNISGVADLNKKLIEAVVLNAAKWPNGYSNIRSIMDTYKATLGLTSVSSNDSVYSQMSGKEYSDINALISDYNALAGSNPQGGGSNSPSGNGGGGGGTAISASDSDVSVITKPYDNGTSDNTEIGMKFKDLSTVRWAYSSISVLYEKGIISGKEEDRYCPEDTVKREEFVKMLVCAMGLETNERNTSFEDVSASAWYAPYVTAAFNSGIVRGISETRFGIGTDITRQDMAVMLYNAILSKGYQAKNAELSFSDNDDISAYAKTAVAELSAIGVINGVGDGRFLPKDNLTRAQAAVVIERALGYLSK